MSYDDQKISRENAEAETRRRGFEPGLLQWLWRSPECFGRPYDQAEVVAAICDALTREGCTAWSGDGTSCVEQMIRLQWDRAVKAERELAELRAAVLPQEAGAAPELRSLREGETRCPCCAGTGRVRAPEPGEMLDI